MAKKLILSRNSKQLAISVLGSSQSMEEENLPHSGSMSISMGSTNLASTSRMSMPIPMSMPSSSSSSSSLSQFPNLNTDTEMDEAFPNFQNANVQNGSRVILTFEETECAFCTELLKVGKGILLQGCLHQFCRHCLETKVESATSLLIDCPYPDCGTKMLESEIKAIASAKVFAKLEKLSCETAMNETSNSFKCQTPKCKGWCFYDEGSKIFLCPLCNKNNCIPCKANHDGITCEEYQDEVKKYEASGAKNPAKCVREFVQKRNQTDGFAQVAAYFANTVQSQGSQPGIYNTMLDSMSQQPIFFSTVEFECIICYDSVPVGEGIILRECCHKFCKNCIISHVEHNTEPQVGCPQPGCSSFMTPREIQAILPPEILAKVTKRSWSLAEAIITTKFHCLTPNCDAFVELEGVVQAFVCPLCSKSNCIGCNAIHDGISCEDFKNQIQQNENDQLSAKAVENLIATGMAMRCTTCKLPVQKDVGCDSIICFMCKTELCWATKGPRWGARGRGDTSGGCKCRAVAGVLCHPQCRNCH